MSHLHAVGDPADGTDVVDGPDLQDEAPTQGRDAQASASRAGRTARVAAARVTGWFRARRAATPAAPVQVEKRSGKAANFLDYRPQTLREMRAHIDATTWFRKREIHPGLELAHDFALRLGFVVKGVLILAEWCTEEWYRLLAGVAVVVALVSLF